MNGYTYMERCWVWHSLLANACKQKKGGNAILLLAYSSTILLRTSSFNNLNLATFHGYDVKHRAITNPTGQFKDYHGDDSKG